jgi:hypothetical protein
MSTSQTKTPSMLYEIAAGLPIPLEKRAYFHARVLNSYYQYVLQKFIEEEQANRLTKAELARRIGRKPEVISRLLGAPGNWTLETATDLLLGISAEELTPASVPLLNRAPRNYKHSDWMSFTQLSTNPPTRSDINWKVSITKNPLELRKFSGTGTADSPIIEVTMR